MGKFSQIEFSQLFKGKIFTNRHRLFRISTEKEKFRGYNFCELNSIREIRKNFPLKNNALCSRITKQ